MTPDNNTDNMTDVLAATIAKLEKQFGKGAIMALGDEASPSRSPAIPTGSLALDLALGVGGYPRGRIVEIYGPESSGKTTLTLHAIAEASARAASPRSSTPSTRSTSTYARALGVDIEKLLVSQPDSGEQALEIAEMLVALGRGRPRRHRLGRGARAEGRDRGRDGRRAHGPAGAAHEPGAPQAHRRRAPEPGRRSSSSTSSARRSASCSATPRRRPAATRSSSTRAMRLDVRRIGAGEGGRGDRRQPHAREGREEQDRAAVPRGRVRHPLRTGNLCGDAICSISPEHHAVIRDRGAGTRSTKSASATAASARASTSSSTPTRAPTSRADSSPSPRRRSTRRHPTTPDFVLGAAPGANGRTGGTTRVRGAASLCRARFRSRTRFEHELELDLELELELELEHELDLELHPSAWRIGVRSCQRGSTSSITKVSTATGWQSKSRSGAQRRPFPRSGNICGTSWFGRQIASC